MKEYAVCIAIDHSTTTIARIVVHIFDAASQQILRNLYDGIRNFSIGHPTRIGCPSVTIHNIHK